MRCCLFVVVVFVDCLLIITCCLAFDGWRLVFVVHDVFLGRCVLPLCFLYVVKVFGKCVSCVVHDVFIVGCRSLFLVCSMLVDGWLFDACVQVQFCVPCVLNVVSCALCYLSW